MGGWGVKSEKVGFRLQPVTQMFVRSREFHLITKKSLESCLSCILRDRGSSHALLETQKEIGRSAGCEECLWLCT